MPEEINEETKASKVLDNGSTTDGESVEIETTEAREQENVPEIDLTEEQAGKAAKGVEQLMRYLKLNRPLKERQQERLEKFKLQRAELPEGSYKIAQLDSKIAILEKKINPSWSWPAEKGTYVKPKDEENEAKKAA